MRLTSLIALGTSLCANAVAAALVCAAPAVVVTQTYLPLTDGSQWTYDGAEEGEHERQTCSGSVTLFGSEVSVIRYDQSTQNNGLTNFWTVEGDGDVNLWGFYRPAGDFGRAYFPPIKMLEAPLTVGQTWTETCDVYTYPDLVNIGELQISFAVYEAGPLSVPAGDFETYGIGFAFPLEQAPPTPVGFSIDGAVETVERGAGATEWWALDVGKVQYHTSDLFQLTMYDLPTPLQPLSWGRLKLRSSATAFRPPEARSAR